MSSIISQSELASFVSGQLDHFDTFSANHSLIIYKRPQETITTIETNNNYFGYGSSPDSSNITYTTISGVFPCVVINMNKDNKDVPIEMVPVFLENGEKIIKVKEDAQSFLENGIVNERFILDGETFVKISSSVLRNYGTQRYYYLKLNQTK